MNTISTQDIKKNLLDTLNKVAQNHENIAIEISEHQKVYLIPAEDYQLLEELRELEQEKIDLDIANERINDPNQKRVSFEQFFDELGI
ncbi:type II toxin-antitoxin system Phd/YefM family antitoxin [Geminocystis sp. GBBB08]|uniref:type II toxin-antitoxin system Phd/YefM family antitoxin n=1 Tax=Geminocystis sp. GBBB08 TaxID=2604140 RepID=UPI0027E2EA3D|nr:type II toxin-antitoxin system Phd/YefM family antitoxin [Geminocystis sp. GBBB08]MBL1210084.1 type II toxin-antitoxin system Phd/YefM family antitoxin [Geminocystis sp. GBBB08]